MFIRNMREDYRQYCRPLGYPLRFSIINFIKILYNNPGYAAVISYRIRRWISFGIRFKPFKLMMRILTIPLVLWCRSYSVCDIAAGAGIDGGLMIQHFSGVIISYQAKIGKNCILHQGCNIVEAHGKAATLGDNVYIGACAVIVGPCEIGNNVSIGAGSVVTKSFPDNVIVAGVPAKIIREKESPRPQPAGVE